MTKNDQFIQNLSKMNSIMLQDLKEGKQWTYCNSSGKKGKDFDDTRAKGKYKINCVDGPQWALKGGSFGSKVVPNNALSWYGGKGKGPVWLNGSAKANAEKYFDLIWVNGKYTVNQLVNKRLVCKGDIFVGFNSMNHTCVFYGYNNGNPRSFDSGHAYCKGSGEGAKMTKWIGSLSSKGSKPICIFRLKDRKHYGLQAGSYKTDKYKEFQRELKERFGVDTSVVNIGGEYCVLLGQYGDKDNAEFYQKHFQSRGINCLVREI
jgi:hypothetical protein